MITRHKFKAPPIYNFKWKIKTFYGYVFLLAFTLRINNFEQKSKHFMQMITCHNFKAPPNNNLKWKNLNISWKCSISWLEYDFILLYQ